MYIFKIFRFGFKTINPLVSNYCSLGSYINGRQYVTSLLGMTMTSESTWYLGVNLPPACLYVNRDGAQFSMFADFINFVNSQSGCQNPSVSWKCHHPMATSHNQSIFCWREPQKKLRSIKYFVEATKAYKYHLILCTHQAPNTSPSTFVNIYEAWLAHLGGLYSLTIMNVLYISS